MVYKIGLISTHGTGKTALAGLLEGELKRRGIQALAIREMSTQARERGLPINEDTSLAAQLWILHRQFAEELVYHHKRHHAPNYQAIICDRGPDNYCYLKRRFGENQYALQLTLGHLRLFPYSRLYLLPIIGEGVAEDGIRSTEQQFREEMDLLIREFLLQHGIHFIELPAPAEEDLFRNEWSKLIVNQTLQDLHQPLPLFM